MSSVEYVDIRTIGAARHNGTWDTNAYRLATADCITDNIGFCRIDGLQIDQTGTAFADFGISVIHGTNSVRSYISNCIIRDSSASGNSHDGIIGGAGGAGSIYYWWNNIIYDFSTSNSAGIDKGADADVTVYAYNNTIRNCNDCVEGANGSIVAINNIVDTGGFDSGSTYGSGSGYNVSEDTTYSQSAFGTTHHASLDTDGVATNQLVDSSETFPNVVVGNIIMNETDTTYTYVTGTSSASSGILDVNNNIFASGETYSIYTNIYSTSVAFVASASDNFHVSTSDTITKQGKDLSDDANLPFGKDIDDDWR
jgi:hypothetical protein